MTTTAPDAAQPSTQRKASTMQKDELTALLRDALSGDRILSSLERDAVIARVIASAARAAELEDEVAEWRECMQFDALMSGPVFKGWDRSQMERCRKKYEACRATEQKQ